MTSYPNYYHNVIFSRTFEKFQSNACHQNSSDDPSPYSYKRNQSSVKHQFADSLEGVSQAAVPDKTLTEDKFSDYCFHLIVGVVEKILLMALQNLVLSGMFLSFFHEEKLKSRNQIFLKYDSDSTLEPLLMMENSTWKPQKTHAPSLKLCFKKLLEGCTQLLEKVDESPKGHSIPSCKTLLRLRTSLLLQYCDCWFPTLQRRWPQAWVLKEGLLLSGE